MTRIPTYHAFEYAPGRIVRGNELDGITTFAAALKGGLRGKARRVAGVLYGNGTTPSATGDSRSMAALDIVDLLLPHLYIRDQIVGYGASVLAGSATAPTVQLIRFKRNFKPDTSIGQTWLSAIEVLHTISHTGGVVARSVIASFHNAFEVEKGYNYRVRVTRAHVDDTVYGAYVDADHPKVG